MLICSIKTRRSGTIYLKMSQKYRRRKSKHYFFSRGGGNVPLSLSTTPLPPNYRLSKATGAGGVPFLPPLSMEQTNHGIMENKFCLTLILPSLHEDFSFIKSSFRSARLKIKLPFSPKRFVIQILADIIYKNLLVRTFT